MAEPKPPVVWSPEALNDIDQLWNDHAGVAGRGTADKIIRQIEKVVVVIDEFPLAGRSRNELRVGLRSHTRALRDRSAETRRRDRGAAGEPCSPSIQRR